jgi:hypothetical protein
MEGMEKEALERAEALMRKAIDRAMEQTNHTASWEDIFGTREKMEYWLDDSNFDKRKIQ